MIWCIVWASIGSKCTILDSHNNHTKHHPLYGYCSIIWLRRDCMTFYILLPILLPKNVNNNHNWPTNCNLNQRIHFHNHCCKRHMTFGTNSSPNSYHTSSVYTCYKNSTYPCNHCLEFQAMLEHLLYKCKQIPGQLHWKSIQTKCIRNNRSCNYKRNFWNTYRQHCSVKVLTSRWNSQKKSSERLYIALEV